MAAGLFSFLIMMVNNIRDIDEDRTHGKHTLAVRFGPARGTVFAIVCCVAAWAIALIYCCCRRLMVADSRSAGDLVRRNTLCRMRRQRE